MNDHYYTQIPSSDHAFREIQVHALGVQARFTTDSGVFSRDGLDRGTEVLLEALPPLKGRVLDLGCGWGAVGVLLALKYPQLQVVMTEINSRAVELSKANLQKNGVQAQVLLGDGFEPVEGVFDVILTNPPIRAGKQTIYTLFEQAGNFLSEDGALYIVIRKQQGAPSALKFLREHYREAEVIERSSGFWVICSKNVIK